MWYAVIKLVLSAGLVVAISEIAKRSALIGGLVASLPLVSVLALIWLYIDTKDPQQVAALSISIFWLVLPSLPFFLVLPLLLRTKLPFFASMSLAAVIMSGSYVLMLVLLKRFGFIAA